MDTWQSAVHAAGTLLCFTALAGLVVRRRAARARTFAAYLALTAAYGLCVAFFPTLISWQVWLVKETLLGLLTLGLALEITVRVFARLPGAAGTARLAIFAILALTAAFLLLDLAPPPRPPFTQSSPAEVAAFEAALSLLPRLAYGTAWTFSALFMVATLGILPLDPLHRVIVVGFGAYLWLYAVSLGMLQPEPVQARVVSDVLTWSFLVMLAVWTYAAWRREREPQAPRRIVRRLWPWT